MSNIQKTALAITKNIGSPVSVGIHTFMFIACFVGALAGWFDFNQMLLVLTTLVSLEAIYLSIFIQMTINYTTQSIEAVGEDIEEIQEDIGELQEDMGEIQEDVGEIEKSVDEIQEDVGEIQEDVEEITEEEASEEVAEEARKMEQAKTLTDIQANLRKLMEDIERLQKTGPNHPTHTPNT